MRLSVPRVAFVCMLFSIHLVVVLPAKTGESTLVVVSLAGEVYQAIDVVLTSVDWKVIKG